MLVEYYGCDRSLLDNPERLLRVLVDAAEIANATPVSPLSHRSEDGRTTVVLIVSESHFALHTWPKQGYASADFYTCGSTSPEAAAEFVGQKLLAVGIETMVIDRGINAAANGDLMLVVGKTVAGNIRDGDTDPG